MEPSVETLCGLLIRAKLLPADTVKALYQRWKSEAKIAHGDVAKFSQWLVARAYVSASQAAQLTQGLRQDATIAEESREDAAQERGRETASATPAAGPFDFGDVTTHAPKRQAVESTPVAPPAERRDAVDTVDFNVDETQPTPIDPAPDSSRALLSLRDWIMMGIGAGAVIVAGLLGMLLARSTS